LKIIYKSNGQEIKKRQKEWNILFGVIASTIVWNTLPAVYGIDLVINHEPTFAYNDFASRLCTSYSRP